MFWHSSVMIRKYKNLGALAFRLSFGVSIVAAFLPANDAYALPVIETGMPRHLECVPVARALSGIQIRGNANTWWDQAEGRYERGQAPKRGAVLAFMPHGGMTLGHVATVSRIVDDRTILVTHANWSIINGRRGQVERDVKVIDVSTAGNWTQVRVWFAPTQDLGTTIWPVHGFIYPEGRPPMQLSSLIAPDPASLAAAEQTFRPTGNLDYLGAMLRKLR
jgi:surface antigen